MNKSRLLGAVCAAVFSFISISSHAALLERLGGLAYYDDVAELTWLTDANAAGTTMNWADANTWAGSLIVGGIGGWRLPNPDTSCVGAFCTGSEMGSLYYTALGNTGSSLINSGPFSNITGGHYWAATEYAPFTEWAWFFSMDNGAQDFDYKTNNFDAWAVYSGDVVPIPPALWLFGSGLLGLVGLARRKV